MSSSAAVPVPPEAQAAAAPAEKRIEPLLLLLGLIALACASTWVLPAGRYDDEVIAFPPALCLLTQRARFDALTAVAMSIGTASVAGTFSPIETFKLGIAQPLAEVPLFSGGSR